MKIARLHNTVRNYAWGDSALMSDLLELPPTAEPQAELWLGAHPSAPSRVDCDGTWRPLDELIAEHPAGWLGDDVAARFENRLPFLLKILCANQPLSLQAHPAKGQAKTGFARENAAGIPVDAPHRSYRDENHKPEILCALTEFWALCGFKAFPDIAAILNALDCTPIRAEADAFIAAPGPGTLRHLFGAILGLQDSDPAPLVDAVLAHAARHADDPAWEWIVRLGDIYPGDVGIAGAALLNVVRLAPGEALYQGAGLLHAYLQGCGVELMANSDNVLRGGLTPKHVDLSELLATLTFEPNSPAVTYPDAAAVYPTPSQEFELQVIEPTEGAEHRCPAGHAIQLAINLGDTATIEGGGLGAPLSLRRGQSIVIPAAAGAWRMTGPGKLYLATVPKP